MRSSSSTASTLLAAIDEDVTGISGAERCLLLALAVDRDRDRESVADLAQAGVGETAESFDEHVDREALNRVEVDGRTPGDRIIVGFHDDLAGECANCRRARRDEHSPKPWDRCIP
jgi:hypothetical protein